MKLLKLIKTSKQKIVNIATNKAIISIAIFFYLVLFLVRTKEKNFGQAIVHGHKIITLLNAPAVVAVPVVAEGVAAAAGGGAAAAAGAGEATAAAGVGAAEAAGAAGATEAAGAAGATEAAGAAGATEAAGAGAGTGGATTAAASEGAGGGGAAAASKPIPTQGSAVSPKNIPKMESEVGNKRAPSFKERYGQAQDIRDSVQSNSKQKDQRMEEENNKGAETETTLDEGTTALTGKSKLNKFALGIVISVAMLFMVATSYVMLSAQQVSPTSTVVTGVGIGAGASDSTATQSIGSMLGAFFEKLKNAVTGNGFYTNEESLYAKIKAEYQSYLQQYGIEIDVPTISATLFYDVDSFGKTDKNNDGLPDIDDHYIERTNNVSTLASFMLQVYESKFNCTQENDNGTAVYKKVFVQTVPIEKSEMKSTNVCSAETVGQSIYEYSYEVDLDHYYEKLTTSDAGINALKSIYGDKAETDIQRRTLSAEIQGYSTQWTDLYGVPLTSKDCPSPGTITSDVLSQMQVPVHEPYKITSYFGYRSGEFAGFHRGIDVVPTEVVNISAAADGIVTRVASGLTKETEGGNIVEITHTFNGVKYVTQYAHLADDSILVNVGDTVKKGQQIAIMGATGQVTGAHLHFQMWKYPYSQNNLINPVNLFEAASNYIYQCKSSAGDQANCSLEGSVASIAQDRGYNFNIIRAIIQYESSSSTSDLLVLGLKPADLKADLDTKLGTPQGQAVAAQINFDDNTVNIDGSWQSFAGSTQQVARHKVVELIGTVNEDVFNDIAMGIGQIKGSNHDAVGYETARDMYDGLSKSKYAQVQAMVMYLEHEGNAVINVLKNIGNMTTDAEIDQAVQTLVDAYRPGGPDAWKSNVISNYKKFRDDPNSTIENYIKQCQSTSIENPKWEVCSTYENKAGCKNNIATYKDVADRLLAQVNNPTRKKILTNAMSLWGYVRYCGARTSDYLTRCNPARYGPVNIYYGQGFIDKWKVLHTYYYDGHQYTAGVAGLDCGGFVTWVYNQTFETKFTYVLNGPCTEPTQYTTPHPFPKSDLSVLQAGDGICYYGDGRHTLIYMGTLNGKYYFIHTGSGSLGVAIFDKSTKGVFAENWSYYFTINK